MSLFSRLTKNIKRGLQKLAPVLSVVAPFIPAIGPLAGTVLGALGGAARTPGIAPPAVARPGGGFRAGLDRNTASPSSIIASRNAIATHQARIAAQRRTAAISGAPARPAQRAPESRRFTPAVQPTVAQPPLPGAPSRGRVIQVPPLGNTRTNQMSIFAALPAIIRGGGAVARVGAGAVGRVLGSPAGRAATAAATGVSLGLSFGGGDGGTCPVGFHLNKARNRVTGQEARTYCVRNRRLNVGNARAARRSVRRLKGARKLLRDIEKMMPSKPRARARAHATPSPIIHTG